MRVPDGWLRELVPVSFPVEEVAHRLTMAGFEVEELLEVDGESVMDTHVNANRGDALSMVGIAREVAALTGGHVIHPVISVKNVFTEYQNHSQHAKEHVCHLCSGPSFASLMLCRREVCTKCVTKIIARHPVPTNDGISQEPLSAHKGKIAAHTAPNPTSRMNDCGKREGRYGAKQNVNTPSNAVATANMPLGVTSISTKFSTSNYTPQPDVSQGYRR
jgi:hypothetical protein